jgi:hypothetical protein
MHKNKGLIRSIQKISNNKTFLTLGDHNFLILAQNQLLLRPIDVVAQGATNLFEDHEQKKWLVTKPLEFEPLSVWSPTKLP